jgi:hypothetical protein
MAIKNTTLDTTPLAIYTSVNDSAVTTIYFCNKTVGPVTFSVHLAHIEQAADATNIIYNNLEIAPTDTFVLDTEKVILADGDSIYATANNADSIVATVSYVGI